MAEGASGSFDGRQVPIAPGLFTWPSANPQLIASKCGGCGELTFPSQGSCPSCTRRDCEEVLLSRRGTLWTFTIMHFPPPVPPFEGDADRETFVPFGVGYVELEEGIRVESRLTENDPEKLQIGMEVELVLEQFGENEDGVPRVTFAFQPVA
jgi:uncharacterized OB-fold protein